MASKVDDRETPAPAHLQIPFQKANGLGPEPS